MEKEKPITELINFGVLNIDKPAGCTSFDVVNHIRKTLGLDKAGHLGTLDPQVTGVLPIVLGKACKIQKGDGIFFFNFRADRARMLTEKLIEKTKNKKIAANNEKINQYMLHVDFFNLID